MGSDAAMENNKSRLYHPKLPDHWQRCSLYSMAEWVNGLAFRNIQFSSKGMPVIKIAEIKSGISGQTKFTQQTFDESVRVRPGDLLFSWSGQPETSIDAFWWRGPEGWLNQHIFRVTPAEGIDRVFFHYLLKYLKPNFVRIAQNKQTTGLGHVTRRDLESIRAGYPPLPEQRAIAHILGTNETLEAMAQALFKSWFVDFDPVVVNAIKAGNPIPDKFAERAAHYRDNPDALGLPEHILRLLPDRFQDSQLGPIPEGWRIGPLSEVTGFLAGYAFKSKDWVEQGVPVVKIRSVKPGIVDLDAVSYVSEEVAEKAKRFRLAVGDLLIGMTGYVGEVGLVPPTDSLPLLNQRVGKFVLDNPGTAALAFLYCLTRRHEFKAQVETKSHGTAQANVSAKGILSIQIIVPPKNLRNIFNRIVQCSLDRILKNVAVSRTLAEIRDVLLPKLISGELRVPDVEKILEGVE